MITQFTDISVNLRVRLIPLSPVKDAVKMFPSFLVNIGVAPRHVWLFKIVFHERIVPQQFPGIFRTDVKLTAFDYQLLPQANSQLALQCYSYTTPEYYTD